MKKPNSLSTSVRRYLIDEFFFKNSSLIRGRVVDIGGKKRNKRGLFDVGKFASEITYVNIDTSTEPDIVSDATNIPLPNASFDTAIIAELLEHVPEPLKVLKEANRLLKPGGTVLVTVPFNVGIHGDPSDFGRYTETMLERMAKEAGFKEIKIERQGTIFAVAGLMLQHLFMSKGVSWRPIQIPLVKFLMWLDTKTTSPLLISWTTGYSIIFTK